MIGAAIRKLNRAASVRSRPMKRPAEMEIPARLTPGKSASGLCDADPERLRERKVGDPPVGPADMVSHPQDRGAHEEQDRDRAGSPDVGLDEIVEQDPDDDRRQHRGDDGATRVFDPDRPANERSRSVANPAGTRRSQSRQK